MRLDRVPLESRVLAALRVGDMTTPELGARLRAQNVLQALHRLEARGLVVRVAPVRGHAVVWSRARRLEASA